LPQRLEHNPSFGNFPGENSTLRYGEGVLVGYRGYEARHLAPLFAFGSGLSFTTFDVGAPCVSATPVHAGDTITVTVPVTNTGARPGTEVVQCYVAPRACPLVRPRKELKAFAKVYLEPGASTDVQLTLGARAFAYWDPGDRDWPMVSSRLVFGNRGTGHHRERAGWAVDPGPYDLHIGRSSAAIDHVVTVTLD
jgi:beta-glucosidase